MKRSRYPLTKGQGFTFFAPHHFYWGLILLVWAFYDIFQGPDALASLTEAWVWLGVGLGLWLCLDDVRQHLKQRHGPYHTLLHNAYWEALSYLRERVPADPKWAWVRRILDWFASV